MTQKGVRNTLRDALEVAIGCVDELAEIDSPAPAVTRDELAKLVETALRGLSLRIGPNASDLLVAGKWQALPLTGAECREIAAVVAEGLEECVDIRLRPTEGSDTDVQAH